MSETVEIGALGAQGDGLVRSAGRGDRFVPFALPGEIVRIAGPDARPRLIELVRPSAERVAPACRHFGTCGGCALQHLAAAPYLAWKRGKLVTALARQGLEPRVAEIVATAPGARRRVVLSARRVAAGAVLGFNVHASHEIVDIAECPVASPALVAALPALHTLAARIAGRGPIRLTVTDTETGLDVAAADVPPLDDAARLAAADLALRSGFARLTADGEVLVEARPPNVRFGVIAVSPPPGGFLQAVAAIESAMAARVAEHLGPAGRIVDLFAGSGAFALRLAGRAAVHAVEGERDALTALDRAARFHEGLKPVTSECRDLERRPLRAAELAPFDGLVFDPPRAGAEAQCREIARSEVPRVAAVSCNPTTFARDLAILVDGGYRIETVTPYDQFLWSPHVEAVALLAKPRRRKRGLL